jgi:hypothetical protein
MKQYSVYIVLIILFAASVVADDSVWREVSTNEASALCDIDGPSGVDFLLAEVKGTNEVRCSYSCSFSWGDPHNQERTSTPLNGDFTVEGTRGQKVSYTAVQVRNACCGTSREICFDNGICYYHPDPSTCSDATYEGDIQCSCSRTLIYINGMTETETITSCIRCQNLAQQCVDGTVPTTVETDEEGFPTSIICEEEPEPQVTIPTITQSCVCPAQGSKGSENDPVVPGESVICTVLGSDGASWDTNPHKHSLGDETIFFPLPDLPCEYHAREPRYDCRCPIEGDKGTQGNPINYDESIACAIFDEDTNEDVYPFYPETAEGEPTSFPVTYNEQQVICTFYAEGEEVIVEPENYRCDCSNVDPVEVGDEVRCEVKDDSGQSLSPRVNTNPFTYQGTTTSFDYNYEGNVVVCDFPVKEPEDEVDSRVRCAGCTLKKPDGRRARNYVCRFSRSGTIVDEFETRVDYHGVPTVQVYSQQFPDSEACEISISTGCESDGQLNGVCPTDCKSWEDPDCDFGPTGLRVVDWLFNIAGIPTPQQWWNEKLSGDGALGAIYSTLDSIPGTPEWFTDQVCKKGLEISDEKACGVLGLSEENCTHDWEGYRVFEGDIVVSLAAEYVSRNAFGDNDHYRISWRLKGIPNSEEYRVFLANTGGSGYGTSYDGYSLLPRNRRVIYPEDGEWTPVESSSYEYETAQRYTDVCVEFKTSSDEWGQHILDALGIDNADTPFICRSIRFYN